MPSKGHYPAQVPPDIEPSALSAQIADLAELRSLPDVKTNEEIKERLDYFFQWCSKKQIRPTVSLMSLALHRSRQALWAAQQRGGELGLIIDDAKRVLEALTEQWLLNGKTNPVSGIFILKSQFGYRDVISVENTTPAQPTAQMTPEEVARQIEADIPLPIDVGEDEP